MNFKLFTKNGEDAYVVINLDLVSLVEKNDQGSCTLFFADGECVDVVGSFDDVCGALTGITPSLLP